MVIIGLLAHRLARERKREREHEYKHNANVDAYSEYDTGVSRKLSFDSQGRAKKESTFYKFILFCAWNTLYDKVLHLVIKNQTFCVGIRWE